MNVQPKPNKLVKGATGEWEVVVGMEVHAQVASNAKLFSGASTAFGGEPNAHVSLVDAAMPGMLPVINEECVRQAIRTGLGLNARINLKSVFDRKNYFYPDLPQGYQISQWKAPIVGEGEVLVDMPDGETVTVRIERLHLEQDAGKSLHDQHATMSFVDLNRSGVALMEIVSRPDLHSAEEAKAYLTKLRTILRYLGTCDGDMEKGNPMRTKEEAHDYRYFPDPDLLPLELTSAYVDDLRHGLPELPDEKRARFVREYALGAYDAGVLVGEREIADFFEAAAKGRDAKSAANWVINELFGRLNKEGLSVGQSPVSAVQLGAILDLIGEGTISGKIAKDLFEIVWSEGGDPRALVEARGLKQVTDVAAIEKIVDDIVAANPDKVAQAKAKPALIGWFVGQAMRASDGRANPQAVNDLLKRKLGI